MKKTLALAFLLMHYLSIAYAQTDLTAEDILNKSLAFCGGIKNISKIKSSDLRYTVTTGDNSPASLIVKRITGEKYMQSFLSDKYQLSSTHFDGSTFANIHGETKTVKKDIAAIEEIKLQTYDQIQYGYRQLSYSLERLEDQKFNYFDCYVVRASAKNGYATLNFFDKTNFRLIMIVYPKGNKSLLMEYVFKDSVLFNTKVVSVETDSVQITWQLKKLDLNAVINPLWFTVAKSESTAVPDNLKMGTFISADSTIVTRTETVQTENSGDFNPTLYLKWFNNYTFVMVNSKSLNKTTVETGDNILVKIVSWDRKQYVCHYFSNGVGGTQEYRVKE